METKRCNTCLEEKTKDNFYNSKKHSDNLIPKCKLCSKNKIPVTVNKTYCGETKKCKACLDNVPLEEFFKRDANKDGYDNKCKKCVKDKVPIPKEIFEEGYKKCKICEQVKIFEDFGRHLECIGGVKAICKHCNNEQEKSKREKIKLDDKIPPETNFKTCSTCKEEKSVNNFSKKSDQKDGLMKRCKKCVAEYHQKNKNEISITQKIYYKNNKESINNYKNNWVKEKRKTDNKFKISTSITALLRNYLSRKNIIKNKKTLEVINCSWEEFKKHIESQFESWMSWENYGNACETLQPNCSWDLDHIIPVSYAKTEEEVYLLNHWSNFQPLCSFKNRNIKRDSIYPVTNLELKITFNKNK